ncbi:MAG: phosphomethylpyrimidine synthase ThiC, partial [Tepidisphaerales bacterium]
MAKTVAFDRSYTLPPLGANPSTDRQGTTPGSFAKPGQIGRPLTFSSPDTPGMPEPSPITAMDFAAASDSQCKTQLEEARSGRISPEARRVALLEPHLTPEQIRVEVAAGRMVIPANKVHLKYKLEPMCIGRASLTKINA